MLTQPSNSRPKARNILLGSNLGEGKGTGRMLGLPVRGSSQNAIGRAVYRRPGQWLHGTYSHEILLTRVGMPHTDSLAHPNFMLPFIHFVSRAKGQIKCSAACPPRSHLSFVSCRFVLTRWCELTVSVHVRLCACRSVRLGGAAVAATLWSGVLLDLGETGSRLPPTLPRR